MKSTILQGGNRPAVAFTPEGIRTFLVTHHFADGLRAQEADADYWPHLEVTVNGRRTFVKDVTPFDQNLLVIMPEQTFKDGAAVSTGTSLVFSLVERHGEWVLSQNTLRIRSSDLDNATLADRLELMLRTLHH